MSSILRNRLVQFLPVFGGMCCLALTVYSRQGTQPGGQNPVPAQVALPTETEIYRRARTVVDMTREELLETYRDELQGLKPTEDQEGLDSLLQKVGENVEKFFRDFPNAIAKEQVRRERLRFDGTVEESVTQNYYYTACLKSGGWEETRTDSRGHEIAHERMSGLSFLTTGFASASLHFRPNHQIGCRFRYLGSQAGESSYFVIAFAQKPATTDIAGEFSSILHPAPIRLLFQGFVWVDPRSYQIVRLRQSLLASRNDAFLSVANSDITYGAVLFQSVATPFWLPQEVVVTLRFSGQQYRNRHRYSDYQVFTVAVEEKISPPVVKK